MKVAKERKDKLTSQRVEVGLVFHEMLGEQEAKEYMLKVGVPTTVVNRVLGSRSVRRESPIDEMEKL
ncbi:hypothetical protein [Pseudoduganella lutea]|uniref:XRE family transcriptional regulator n=1 Tax=Pseudoduganella lutea TaxID=321985 RepID=A0A4P6L644_9BURK|nr:hypothetical protein [Pseudoduganella lutea]QBE66332.1 hypothetical protein EWM63_27940 [Pseudoduganella lutea]